MRKALLLALAVSCSKSGAPPAIGSFTADDLTPEQGAPVTFTWSVTGATKGVRIDPLPGPVQGNSVTVVPPYSTVFTLTAANESGSAARDLAINVRPAPPFAIDATDANPGQVSPGGAVTLSWAASRAARTTLAEGSSGAPADVPTTGSTVVHPASTTAYVLTAYGRPGASPAVVTATITARVVVPPTVTSFTASPGSILQGEASTLRWKGNAAAYTVTDGTTSFPVGPRLSLVVRPSASTTYTLHATGFGLDLPAPPQATVTVTPQPATTLEYTPPAAGALRLVADPCASPCGTITLRVVAAADVQLRGAALDLPLDGTKAAFDPTTFAPGPVFANAIAKAAKGSGPLQGAAVLAIALPATAGVLAPDVTLSNGGELLHFSLSLEPSGGRGTVFDGLAASPSAYKAVVQSGSGRATNAIAVGTLEAR